MSKNNNMDKRPQIKGTTIKRLLKLITSRYKKRLVLVFICLVISAIVSVCQPIFIRTIIDDQITPLLMNETKDYSGLLNVIYIMIIVFSLGVVASYVYNRNMVTS